MGVYDFYRIKGEYTILSLVIIMNPDNNMQICKDIFFPPGFIIFLI
jgi:hypothetical protein